MSVNNVQLLGNVGADPELKTLSNGQPVVNFRMTTTDRWYDKDTNEQREATEWHHIVAYRKLAELIQRHVKKGSQIYLEGRLKTRSWDKDGVKFYKTEIEASKVEFLGKKEEPMKADKSYHSDRYNKDEAPF
jgi:single-strand DNA-binding protein